MTPHEKYDRALGVTVFMGFLLLIMLVFISAPPWGYLALAGTFVLVWGIIHGLLVGW